MTTFHNKILTQDNAKFIFEGLFRSFLAVQAVDGTKIAANAAGDRTYSKAELQRLLERTEAAISKLEAQNEVGDESPIPRLPEELQKANKLQQRIRDAMNHLAQ